MFSNPDGGVLVIKVVVVAVAVLVLNKVKFSSFKLLLKSSDWDFSDFLLSKSFPVLHPRNFNSRIPHFCILPSLFDKYGEN